MYTHITATKNGYDSIKYCREGRDENGKFKGHNSNEIRNVMTFGVNMLPDDVVPYEVQMQKYWDQATPQHKIQTRRVYCSASVKELPLEDPNSPIKLAMAMQEFFEKNFSDRQVAIFIQNDGKSGLWHGHAIINDCGFDAARGIGNSRKEDYRDKAWWYEKEFDKVFAKYVEKLDNSKQNPVNKKTQAERSLDEGKFKRKIKREVDGEVVEEVVDRYSWRKDLKDRIKLAMDEAVDQDDLINNKLADHGVRIVPYGEDDDKIFHESKDGRVYVTYELTDLKDFIAAGEKVPKKRTYFRCKSYKLGEDYELIPPDDVIKTLKPAEIDVSEPIDEPGERRDDDFHSPAGSNRSQQEEIVENTEENVSVTVINEPVGEPVVITPSFDQDDDQDEKDDDGDDGGDDDAFFKKMRAEVSVAKAEKPEELSDAQKYIQDVIRRGEELGEELETKSILDELDTDDNDDKE